MTITAESSLVDVCFAVCTALDPAGTVAVLSGGSGATFYASQAYQSRDADSVITMHGSGGAVVMANIGYTESGGIYSHAVNPFTVEFPKGPLSVGAPS
jgi:hypothetical protein